MVGTARPRCGHLAAPEWLLCAPWFSNSACQCDGNRRGSYRVALCVAESAHMINRRSPRRVQPWGGPLGAALLRVLTDKTGLTGGLSRALATDRLLTHDRGRVLADLAWLESGD